MWRWDSQFGHWPSILGLTWCCLTGGLPGHGADRVNYPLSPTVDQVDDYHGTLVADPYRWLEDDVRTNPQVAEWVAAQNRVTFEFLEQIPERTRIRERLTELWDYEKFSTPSRQGQQYVWSRNDGLQNQYVLYTLKTLDSPLEVLIDPNQWSTDGTVALAGASFSEDGSKVAYGVQDAGSDWRTWRVLDVTTRQPLSDELRWVKFNSPDWLKDGSGFFYARYPEPQADAAFQSLNLNQKVYFHKLGTPQSADVLIFEQPDHPEWGFQASVSDDGLWLVITAWIGTDDKYRVYVKSLADLNSPVTHLVGEFDHEFRFLGNDGQWFYFRTDQGAPRKRLIAISVDQPAPEHWRELIPERPEVLDDITLVGNQFFASYLKDAVTQVKVFDLQGQPLRDVTLEGLGTANGFRGKRSSTETFYIYSSFATPPSLFRYDLESGENTLIRRAEVKMRPEDFETKQVFVTSRDGTRVPMFITHRRGLVLDGQQPTLLYGYGGFNIPLTPSFRVSRVMWLEMGGVYAVANLRGGGEYGEDWHRAGTKLHKQNVFDDFIAAAEWLIASGYTSPQKLAIQGGSNGGLLVGACITQRPELFAAALPAVGVMDMLRFHRFTAGRFWTDDYGSADHPQEFAALYAYSPYHRLQSGKQYPATLVTTADTDDRVVPGHSFKFAARLQACQSGPAPTLIRIETRAGHGAGKPTKKMIEEETDQLAFLSKILGMTVTP